MKLIFEKDGKQIEVEQTSKNHMLQVADYVKNGYTYIGTDEPSDETAVESLEPVIEQEEPKAKKVVQKRVLFTKGKTVKSVGYGVASYLHIYIIALTLSYILSILPRQVVRGSIGDVLSLIIFVVTLYTLFKIVQNRQFKLVFINFFIIGIFIFAGLFIAGFISFLIPFNGFTDMILNFIVYVIQVTIIYDMANHLNLASMKEYIKDGYEINNADELTEEELNQINDLNYVKPFWQIVS
jgi:hypothetical protein